MKLGHKYPPVVPTRTTPPARWSLTIAWAVVATLGVLALSGCSVPVTDLDDCHRAGGTWWDQRDCVHAAWRDRLVKD
jgi:hypothetical protein